MAEKGKVLEAIIRIGGQMDASVKKSIKKTTDAINGVGVKFAKIEKAAALAGAAMAAAFTGAAAAIAKASVEAAATFEKSLSNIETLLDGDAAARKKRMAEIGKEAIRISNITGKSTADITEGIYQVISAFGDEADSMKIAEIAAKAGVAGNASTIEAINLLSAVTKGYGDTSAEANSKAADLAFMTVKLGQTTFPELAAAMGKVIPIASALGVTQEELFGAFATATGPLGATAEVATQLKAVAAAFLTPSKQLSAAVKKLGYDSEQAMIQELGLRESLLALKDLENGDMVALGNMFGSQEAKSAVLKLAGELAEAFEEKSAAMGGDAAGIAERAFNIQMDNVLAILDKLQNKWKNIKTDIGNSILPSIKNALEKNLPKIEVAMDKFKVAAIQVVNALREWAASVDWAALSQKFMAAMESIKNALATVYAFVQHNKGALIMVGKALAAIWAAFHAVFLAVKAFAACKAVIATVAAVFSALASTVGIVVVAIAAIGVAAWALYEYWDEVCAACSKAWAWLCGKLQDAWAKFSAKYQTTAKFLETAWNMLCAGIKLAIKHIAFSWQTFCEVIQIAWQGFMAFIVPAWGAVKEVWNMVCTGFGNAFHLAMTAIETALNVIMGVVNGWIALFKGDWDGACAHFKSAFEAVCNFWQTLWQTLISGWQSTIASFRVIADAIKGAFTSAWDAVKDRVRAVVESIMSYLQPLIDKVKWVVDGLSSAKDALANSSVNPANWFAAGGFTSGPSICGEAGTEAVISFDPAYRKENQGYLMTAAEMLGMTAAPASGGGNTFNNSISFSPVITVGERADRGDIMRKLRACVPELMDLIEEAMNERNSHRYA